MEERTYKVTVEDGFILVKFAEQSVLTYDGIISAFDAKTALPEYKTLSSLWDFRACKPEKSLNYKTIMDMVNYMKSKHSPEWEAKRAGILVDSRLVYGMLRMFQILGEDLPFEVKVFQKEDEAVHWVKG